MQPRGIPRGCWSIQIFRSQIWDDHIIELFAPLGMELCHPHPIFFVFNIDIVSNDGGGNSGFALRTWYGGKASISGMRPLRYQDLFPAGDWRDWHHYAILWDINGISGLPGSPKTALLVDGKLTIGTQYDTIIITPSTKAHVLGITCDPALSPRHNTKSPFLIDDIKIWNYAKIDVLP